MKKEDVALLAQLLHAMRDVAAKMEHYAKKKDIDQFNAAKKELISLQRRINELV